jgi:hypothetical protein
MPFRFFVLIQCCISFNNSEGSSLKGVGVRKETGFGVREETGVGCRAGAGVGPTVGAPGGGSDRVALHLRPVDIFMNLCIVSSLFNFDVGNT